MSEVVLDASVIVKWVLPERPGETDGPRALRLLGAMGAGRISVVEPPHWLAEVAAVVTRLAPERALRVVELLHALELPILDEPEVYREAVRLAARSGEHVFDTLYHAVALRRPDALLVTADGRYYRRGRTAGRVLMLADFAVPAD